MDKATKAAVPGMAVQALAGEIIDALLKDEKNGGYDLTAGLFGGEFSTLDLYPSFDHIGQLKLDDLKARGYSITGYAIEKPGTGPHPERGFVTAGGFVGWWRSDEQAAVVCKSEQKRLATLWGFVPQGASDQALADVIKERDDAEEFGDKLLDLVLGSDRPEWSSAYGTDDALLQVEEKMVALERAQAAPADPMDWPLPCDVKVGSGTMHKGVPLRTLVLRMQMLHDRAAPAGIDRPQVPRHIGQLIDAYGASRADEDGQSGTRIGELIAALRDWAASFATPALPNSVDSSAVDLAEVQAEPVAWMRKTDITELTDSAPETDGWTPLYVAPQAQPADALDAWQAIGSLPTCDDLIWLYCQDTNTIDGPVAPHPMYEDSWTHWAYAQAPSTATIDAAMAAAQEGGKA
jgi:hypothetical protein